MPASDPPGTKGADPVTGADVETTRHADASLLLIARAPVRVADLGGWTDTWFARHGEVCHLAVGPGVEVRLRTFARGGRPPLVLELHDFHERHAVDDLASIAARHPLLAAALEAGTLAHEFAYEIEIGSAVPPGASMGTSAAVIVAILAACDVLRDGMVQLASLPRRAHAVEVERMGRESGVQDQVAAAHGGVNYLEIAYPDVTRRRLPLQPETVMALDARLLSIYVGRGHDSSAVHRDVIEMLDRRAGAALGALDALRAAARSGRDALLAGDLAAYGRALIANTEAQRQLHPALVSRQVAQLIDIARAHAAAGWKVNGAGGEGGSVTLLCDRQPGARDRLTAAIIEAHPDVRVLSLGLAARGVTVERAGTGRG
jgi:D-glycero-alpha-D-manno-heptose-7-phosphate kinase